VPSGMVTKRYQQILGMLRQGKGQGEGVFGRGMGADTWRGSEWSEFPKGFT